MIRFAIGFLIVGLVSFAVGAGEFGVLSMEAGKLVFKVFILLAVLSLLASFFANGKTKTPT